MDKSLQLNVKLFGCVNQLCLSPTEAIVMAHITTFTLFGKGFFGGHDLLAEECRCSSRTIRRVLNALSERGLITSTAKTTNHSTKTYVASDTVLSQIQKAIVNDSDVLEHQSEDEDSTSSNQKLSARLFSRVNRLCKSPVEVIVLGYVTSFTAFGAGFYAGQNRLSQECCCSKETVKDALRSLRERGLITTKERKPNYSTTTYVATERVLSLIQNDMNDHSKETKCTQREDNMTPKRKKTKKHNPPLSPQGEAERKQRKPVKKNRALNYLHGHEKYDEESLRAMGISLGEEFYADDDAV